MNLKEDWHLILFLIVVGTLLLLKILHKIPVVD
jgi:hypothetical protein